MKRVKETLAVLFLSLVLGSCGSLMDNNILLSIHKGMTQEEVTKLLGRPDYRRFDEQGEQWEYRKGGVRTLSKESKLLTRLFLKSIRIVVP